MCAENDLKHEAISFLKQLQDAGDKFVFLGERALRAEEPGPEDRESGSGDPDAGLSESSGSAARPMEELRREILGCTLCRLHTGRTKMVFGAGDPDADLMFIGEGPGAEEDRQGLPFVGASGQLLTKIIASIGFKRSEVFIGNLIKCRPPRNRDPEPDEIEACENYMLAQIDIIKPRVIITLGRYSAYYFHGRKAPMKHLRGLPADFNGIKVVSTYHPAALLRNPALKRDVWQDMLLAREIYDRRGGKPSSGEVFSPGRKAGG